jgi:hypothetical protein
MKNVSNQAMANNFINNGTSSCFSANVDIKNNNNNTTVSQSCDINNKRNWTAQKSWEDIRGSTTKTSAIPTNTSMMMMIDSEDENYQSNSNKKSKQQQRIGQQQLNQQQQQQQQQQNNLERRRIVTTTVTHQNTKKTRFNNSDNIQRMQHKNIFSKEQQQLHQQQHHKTTLASNILPKSRKRSNILNQLSKYDNDAATSNINEDDTTNYFSFPRASNDKLQQRRRLIVVGTSASTNTTNTTRSCNNADASINNNSDTPVCTSATKSTTATTATTATKMNNSIDHNDDVYAHNDNNKKINSIHLHVSNLLLDLLFGIHTNGLQNNDRNEDSLDILLKLCNNNNNNNDNNSVSESTSMTSLSSSSSSSNGTASREESTTAIEYCTAISDKGGDIILIKLFTQYIYNNDWDRIRKLCVLVSYIGQQIPKFCRNALQLSILPLIVQSLVLHKQQQQQIQSSPLSSSTASIVSLSLHQTAASYCLIVLCTHIQVPTTSTPTTKAVTTTTTSTGFDQQKQQQNILVFNNVGYNSSRRNYIATNTTTSGVPAVQQQQDQVVDDMYDTVLEIIDQIVQFMKIVMTNWKNIQDSCDALEKLLLLIVTTTAQYIDACTTYDGMTMNSTTGISIGTTTTTTAATIDKIRQQVESHDTVIPILSKIIGLYPDNKRIQMSARNILKILL